MTRRDLLVALLLAAAAPALASEKPEKKKASSGNYLQIQALSATIDKGGGRRGIMSMECGLDVPDAKLRDQAQLLLPRLRAAYLQALQIYAAGLSPGELPEPDILGRQLQRQTDVQLGRAGARLLLGSVIIS